MTRGRLLALAVALTGLLTVSACTGVPLSSEPQVVTPLGDGSTPAAPTISPEPGADPRAIVKGFLAANATTDEHHSAAKAFLTRGTRNRWSDTTVTVVDSQTVGNFDPRDSTITVTGRQVGTVSAVGIYSPILRGDGTGGDPVPISFGLAREDGQWRIDTLKNGLLLTVEDFQRTFQQHPLYFFDLAEKRLVPDPRYTSLTDPSALATFLVSQLANPNGPRSELQSAVTTELPAQSDPQSVSVTTGSTTVVTLPGAGQLDQQTRTHLAAQLAVTLQQVVGASGEIQIVDGGRPVPIPGVGPGFSPSDFSSLLEPVTTTPALYYVRQGAVVGSDGRPMTGALGDGGYGVTSVGLATTDPGDMLVAVTSGPPGSARLLVGTLRTSMHEVRGVKGQLSRPTWAPGINEVWVGVGQFIFRASSTGRPSKVLVSTIGSNKVSGRVAALRFSPEGSRVAIVLAASDGTAQVWVGSVVRASGQVRVEDAEPISPQGIVVTDVAWNDQMKLFAIGRDQATGEANVFEVQVDGSLWTPRSVTNLPDAPDSITVAENVPAWVSAADTVWTQRGSTWSGPGFENSGTNPVYVE